MAEENGQDAPPSLDQTVSASVPAGNEGARNSRVISVGSGEEGTTTVTGGAPTAEGATTTAASESPARIDTAEMPDGDESVDGESAVTVAEAARDDTVEINGVPPNDVKNIILQVLSPYFDDEGGEDDAQHYDHIKAQGWIQLICDGIMEKLLGMRRPYKYVVHCMIMRKCGAGVHVCSSCYYSQADGWVNHAHDLSAHIYAVVTVYWSAI
ncbi:putative dynein light chain [Trypanosoma theileri]|uniref:Putative dynein light chain n=1 Tax=Trypanosoma theileri TaxID=67003 RepID=A0A1X0P6W1_9TRYP|nr:putative dynein light chain [Trypanosoma theileri]ORC92664.1 putative dynein light chain [Trypanosoma theileri]